MTKRLVAGLAALVLIVIVVAAFVLSSQTQEERDAANASVTPTGSIGQDPARAERSGSQPPNEGLPERSGGPSPRDLIYPEVAAVAESVGSDVARLLTFVSEQIRYEPYEGALRGPRGTLLAGAGNAIDRALLLRDLIRKARPELEVRFALGTLTPEQAADTLSHLRSAELSKAVSEVASKPPVPQGESTRVAEQWQQLAEKVRQDARDLRRVLETAGIPPVAPGFNNQRAVEDTQRHVWLQVREGDNWVDLDPSAEDGRGTRRCDPEVIAADLPEELFHVVGVQVRVEKRHEATTADRVLLAGQWRAADLVGSSILFTHAEPAGLEPPARPSASPGQRAYTPTLILDGEELFGQPFFLPEPPTPDVDALPGVGGLARGIGALLGGRSRQQASPPEPVVPDDVVAVSLQLVLIAPDGTLRTFKRAIFDRRFSETGVPSPGSPLALLPVAYGEYGPLISVWSIATWSGERALPRSLNPAVRIEREPETLEEMREQFALLHRAYFVLRHVLYAAAARVPRSQLHVRAPNLSLLSWRVGASGSDTGSLLVDVVASQGEPLAEESAAPSASELQSVWAYASLYAERMLILGSPSQKEQISAVPSQTLADVASVFARAKDENVRLLVLQPGAAQVDQIRASPGAVARLRDRLLEGRVVVVPERAVTLQGRNVLGWWLFDPPSGTYLDEMETGGHQVVGEQTAVTGQRRQQTAATRAGFWPRVRRGVSCAARLSVVLLQFGELAADVKKGDIPAVIGDLDEAGEAGGGLMSGCSAGGLPPPPSTGPKGGKWKPPRWPAPKNTPPPTGPRLPQRPPWRGAPRGR